MIYINSPGGSVAPTQDIYRRILELRKKIPVICTMGDVAASGGYYLAAACEEIYVLPGTTTGSIGVIFQFFNFENLVSWAKLKPVTIKAGKFKDIGSPFREMKVEELAYLQDLLNQVHEQFIKDILSQRSAKIKENVLREQADGRIFTGEQAIKLGFADKVGGFNEALKNLRETKNLGDLEVRRFPKPRRKKDSLLAQMDGKSNFSEQLKSLGIDHLHPFQGMAPMLLPSYLLQAGR